MKRTLVALGIAAGLLLPAGQVLAAPVNAPNAFVAPITCTTATGTYDLTIVSNSGQASEHGNGVPQNLNAAFVISGGTGKVIPTSATLTFSGPDGSQTETLSKGNAQGPASGVPASCWFSLTFNESGETYTFSGTIVGYWLTK